MMFPRLPSSFHMVHLLKIYDIGIVIINVDINIVVGVVDFRIVVVCVVVDLHFVSS